RPSQPAPADCASTSTSQVVLMSANRTDRRGWKSFWQSSASTNTYNAAAGPHCVHPHGYLTLAMMQATSLAFATLAAVSLASATARGGGLSSAEVERLQRGDTVTREQTLERGDGRYVGGVTYTMIGASTGR